MLRVQECFPIERLWRAFASTGVLLCLATSIHLLRAQEPVQQQPLTLQAALAYARQHSPRLAASKQGVTTEQEAIAGARAERLPRFDTGAAFLGSNLATATAFGVPFTPLADVPKQPFQNSHLSAGVFATLPLYTGGRIAAGTHVAEAQRGLAQSNALDVQRDLDFEVTSNYARLVELDRDVQAAQESVNALTESRRVVYQMLTEGKVARVDLLKIDTRLADVRATLIELTNARQIQAGQLNAVMGRAVETSVIIETTLPHAAVTISVEQAMDAAGGQNTKYQVAEAQVDVARRSVELAESQLRPSVSLAADVIGQGADPYTVYKSGAIGGIVFSFPAFDRTLHYRVQEAESRELERRKQVDQVRLDARQRARAAYLRVQDADERIRATQTSIEYAQEALRIEEEKQRYGRGTIEHLLDAQAALLNSEATYYRALADHVVAVGDLTRETGLQF